MDGSSRGIENKNDQVAAAASSLNLLLREDSLLMEHGLTESGSDEKAFSYAAALLEDNSSSSTQQRADIALQDVERKLALVESLAVKLSRTSPEAVAGHLLRLHGYQLQNSATTSDEAAATTTTLTSIRDRADRLSRQSQVLENVAVRVETSLTKGLDRMKAATTRLERVLTLSSTLKRILRLQFEGTKLRNYDLEDLRDLTRAAASVSVVEDLLQQPELRGNIQVVEQLRPEMTQIASTVRQAAATLLKEQYQKSTSLAQLGSTLQVYYHLGELPDAVWKAVDLAHAKAEDVSRNLFNPMTLTNLVEQAKKNSKDHRQTQKKLTAMRVQTADEWAAGVFEAATQVRNLNRVLSRKTDPVKRTVFLDVVAAAPIPTVYPNRKEFALTRLFWGRFCNTLQDILKGTLNQENIRSEVAAIYPAIRSVSKDMISSLHDNLPAAMLEDVGSTTTSGILGGSLGLDDPFLDWSTGQDTVNPQSATSADTWTWSNEPAREKGPSFHAAQGSLSAILESNEWKLLHGTPGYPTGLYLLQKAFVESCMERLCSPLQYMFPENVTVDEDGVPLASGLGMLPSKYDIQRFDENIRHELALADPREGGGDLTTVTMISECVVSMISQFCKRAKNALSGVAEAGYLNENWSMTDALQHDRKIAAMMYTLAKYLRQAPDKTFVAPYRPTSMPQHEESSALCSTALKPALQEIDKMVKNTILAPLCRAVNQRLALLLCKIHYGIYKEGMSGTDDDSPSFVQKHLTNVFENISDDILAKFPPEYAAEVSSTISKYTVYSFISYASLLRPLGESVRLHITQDLADLELMLEQFVSKANSSLSLPQIDQSRPYAELRAVRQMLFWAGLDNKSRSPQDIAKSLLREPWIKDVRPSTALHYLFSFGPNLLSSPHHMARSRIEEYINSLVKLDGSVDDCEDDAWMIIMTCCDSYHQRASSTSIAQEGDNRVPQVISLLGVELLRRRR